MTTQTTNQTEQRQLRRTRVGVVAAAGRMKTVTVHIERRVKHWKYGKYQLRTGSCQVHDEKNEAKVGDQVEIMECRPISKTKKFRLVKVLRRAGGAV